MKPFVKPRKLATKKDANLDIDLKTKTDHSVSCAPPKCRYTPNLLEDAVVPRVCSAMDLVDEGEVCRFPSIGRSARTNGEGVRITMSR